MSRHEPKAGSTDPDVGRGRVRAYLHRFFTSWVAEEPAPTYSSLDRADGLDQVPDPVCEPRVQLPESVEVAGYPSSADWARRSMAGRAAR